MSGGVLGHGGHDAGLLELGVRQQGEDPGEALVAELAGLPPLLVQLGLRVLLGAGAVAGDGDVAVLVDVVDGGALLLGTIEEHQGDQHAAADLPDDGGHRHVGGVELVGGGVVLHDLPLEGGQAARVLEGDRGLAGGDLDGLHRLRVALLLGLVQPVTHQEPVPHVAQLLPLPVGRACLLPDAEVQLDLRRDLGAHRADDPAPLVVQERALATHAEEVAVVLERVQGAGLGDGLRREGLAHGARVRGGELVRVLAHGDHSSLLGGRNVVLVTLKQGHLWKKWDFSLFWRP
ncbi:MAG: hypothetical protein A2563_02885 [Candidatus Magasanikbacteria bacterium RIFOXYD1_FULL_40_23]|uniref:Uncharacterized protein n=1 Tax=Candidatus Magasanikbacteria bacterium RIFOXYD1_FULL_40_23 TaxID=1798705 RepID=A0A1F6P8U9_9BACT|nr:MAG: hypothetical protein A2563_02885 [Candidatus Magasanikbacteria bacterium RIFOXYD1_FULL_40_23]